MSWEEVRVVEISCQCGKGTVIHRTEMDDWNRVRNYRELTCPDCLEKERIVDEANRVKRLKKEELYKKAKEIAASRYLSQWECMFKGLNKKDAWQLLTGGSGYPALGTFYKHVKDKGIIPYVSWKFENGFEEALDTMEIKDVEIISLLKEMESI